METYTSMKEKRISKKVKGYFGKSLKEIRVFVTPECSGHGLTVSFIEAKYTDFKPERTARRELEAMFDNTEIMLTRTYSAKAKEDALTQMREAYGDITDRMVQADEFECEVAAWLYGKTI